MTSAAAIERASADAHLSPTDAQKEAGNYRKGHIALHGLGISIENPRGTQRSGIGADGEPWRVRMPDHYGYIKRTEGADGDQVDVYVGPDPHCEKCYVINQIDADTGDFDEHKAMMGYLTAGDAMRSYVKSFSDDRGHERLGGMKEMDLAEFKDWLGSGKTKKAIKLARGGRVYADGGAIPLPRARQETLLDQARQEFPILGAHDIDFKYSPGRSDGFLEFWPPDEPGSNDYPRPREFAPGRMGVEVFNPKTRPIDVAGDVVSHHLVKTDPQLRDTYEKFTGSLEPWQHDRMREQYAHARANEGERRSFDAWRDSSGLPAYFRGYPFQQWDNAQEMYTPGQMRMLDGMMQRLRAPAQHRASGGAVEDGLSFDHLVPQADAPGGAISFDHLVPKKKEQARSLTSYLPDAITDIPREVYQSTADALTATRDLNLPKGWGGQRDQLNEGALENLKKTGQGLLAAASVPFAPLQGAWRSLAGHSLQSADRLARDTLVQSGGEERVRAAERKLGAPEGGMTYEQGKEGADLASMGMAPARGGLPALRAPAPPAAARATTGPLGVTLSEGQMTGELPAIRREQAALRGQLGEAAERQASGFVTQQAEEVRGAAGDIARRITGNATPFETPADAARAINTEIADAAARARQARGTAEATAVSEEAATRGMLTDEGRALGDIVAEGRAQVGAPREAGEVTGTAIRQTAARDRANYQRLYDEALGLEGQFDAGAFEGIGNRIQGRLSAGDNPVIIDDVTTPVASRAIRDLDNISNLRFQNRAQPVGTELVEAGSDPQVVAVDLRGVDQARKRLVAYYRAARSSNNASDARAAGRLIDEFDGQIETAISNGLFSGDARALDAIREARAAYSRYSRQYRPTQAGDDVGNAMRRIIDRQATPEEIANMVIGSGRVGSTGLPVRIFDRLEAVLGRDSDALSAIRQGIWQKASQVRNGAGEIDLQRSATGITELADSSLGRRAFQPEELRAMRGYARSVRQLEDTVQALPSVQRAEQARSAYEATFSGEGIGGAQATTFRRIAEGVATPEETAQAVFHAIGSGNPGNVTRLINAVERLTGAGSESMSAIRQGVWQKLVEPIGTADGPGAQKAHSALNQFINGRGRTIAEQLYRPDVLSAMREYADLQKRLIVPPSGANRSETAAFVAPMLRKLGGKIGLLIGAVVGHTVAPGLPWGVGEAVGAGIAKGAAKIGDRLEARVIAKQMPLVADAAVKLQQAANRAARLNSPPSRTSLAVATTNLAGALKPMGITLEGLSATAPSANGRQQ